MFVTVVHLRDPTPSFPLSPTQETPDVPPRRSLPPFRGSPHFSRMGHPDPPEEVLLPAHPGHEGPEGRVVRVVEGQQECHHHVEESHSERVET